MSVSFSCCIAFVSYEPSYRASCVGLSCGVEGLIRLYPPHCFLQSLLFFSLWRRPSCLGLKVFVGRFFVFLLPVVYTRNHETAGSGREKPERCSVLKVKLSGCSELFSVLAAAQKAWRSLSGPSPVADLWRICSGSRNLCAVLLPNLFNAFVIALRFITSLCKGLIRISCEMSLILF